MLYLTNFWRLRAVQCAGLNLGGKKLKLIYLKLLFLVYSNWKIFAKQIFAKQKAILNVLHFGVEDPFPFKTKIFPGTQLLDSP